MPESTKTQSSDRIHSAVEFMRGRNLEYLVALHDGVHSFLEPDPVFLLSDFKCMGPSLVLLRSDGTSKLFLTPGWDLQRATERSRTDSADAFENIGDIVSSLSKEPNIGKKNTSALVGLNQVEYSMADSILSSSLFGGDAPLVLDDAFFREVGRTKSSAELERARKATEIAEESYKRMLEHARPGIFEYELAAEVDVHAKSLGADDDFLLLSGSEHNRAVHPPVRRVLERGDIMLSEISPSFRSQFVQICRTVVIGTKTPALEKNYGLMRESMYRGMEACLPGTTMKDVLKVMNEPLERAGLGEYCKPPFMRVRGHGLGISSILPGDIAPENGAVLEKDMMFVIHPNQYLPKSGYLLCGEPIVITESGAKSLTKSGPALDTTAR